MRIFPLKSTVFKNVNTGGAKDLSQFGEPIKITSASPTGSAPSISGGQCLFSISYLASFTAVLCENE